MKYNIQYLQQYFQTSSYKKLVVSFLTIKKVKKILTYLGFIFSQYSIWKINHIQISSRVVFMS
jgi:hypothetical protein